MPNTGTTNARIVIIFITAVSILTLLLLWFIIFVGIRIRRMEIQ
uniref:Uncharacterized protein n=1 Tax=candidate division WOR-3 bacterium TaxID=2052148 RepID=A0A7C6EIY3_UNCW3